MTSEGRLRAVTGQKDDGLKESMLYSWRVVRVTYDFAAVSEKISHWNRCFEMYNPKGLYVA